MVAINVLVGEIILSAILACIAYFFIGTKEQKSWYSNATTLTSILIAIIIIIYQMIGNNLAAVADYNPTLFNASQSEFYLAHCTIGKGPSVNIPLSVYENYTFDVKRILLKGCITTTATRIAVYQSLIIISLIAMSFMFGVLNEKLALKEHNKHETIFKISKFLMWGFVIFTLVAQIEIILSFLYAPLAFY